MTKPIYKIISRAEAKEQDLKHYFTGKPCKRGHINERLVSTHICVECTILHNKKYYLENQEILNNDSNQRYKENPERFKQRYLKNRERVKQLNKKWQQSNPHKVAWYFRIRHTSLLKAAPGWFEEDLVKQLYNKRTELNLLWGTDLAVDHIIPLNPRDRSVCGLHCWANLQLLDKSLNSAKCDTYQTDW